VVTRADSPPAKDQSSPVTDAGEVAGSARHARRERRLSAAAVAIPTILAAALCLYEITGPSLGFDEAASVTIAAQHGGALWSAIAHDGGNMSGYYVLLHVLIGLFGNSTLVIRLPSALAITATVAIIGLLGLRLFDRRVAFASGLLTAVSLPLVAWGQDARGYAPMVALVSASFLAFVALVDAQQDGRRRRWPWIGYVLAITLAVYSSFVAILVVPAQLIMLIWRRRSARPVAWALALVAVSCTPLLVLALRRGSGQLFWVPRPSFTPEKQVLEALTSSGLQPNFRPTSTTFLLLGLTVLLLVLVAAMIVRGLRSGAGGRFAWGQGLVVSWLLVPVALAWLESLLGQSIFLPRNLLMAVPAVGLLLALGLTDRRAPVWLGWSVLAALLVLRALQLAPSYGVSPEGWRQATSYVLTRAQAQDCIAFYPSDGRMAFQYYIGTGPSAAARAPASVLPAVPWGEVRPYVEDYVALHRSDLSALRTRCPRLWFVASHQGQRTGPAGSRVNYARYLNLRSALEQEYPARRHTVSFGYASPVRVELLTR
jgi:Dolichyl-phosphate-mannose-protein mannosyltransferase